jgi:hypothetical protein
VFSDLLTYISSYYDHLRERLHHSISKEQSITFLKVVVFGKVILSVLNVDAISSLHQYHTPRLSTCVADHYLLWEINNDAPAELSWDFEWDIGISNNPVHEATTKLRFSQESDLRAPSSFYSLWLAFFSVFCGLALLMP